MSQDQNEEFQYDQSRVDRSGCWTEENWEQEIEKHPLFTSKSPDPDQPQSELIEAISQLKYSPEFNSVEELMNSYREDGNQNFKNKRYRWAVDAYTEGIRLALEHSKSNSLDENCQKNLSILYNNRASAHFHLQNYRSSMNDALKASELDHYNLKSIHRYCQCCFQLEKYDLCIEFGQKHIKNFDPNDKIVTSIFNLIEKSQKNLKIQTRNKRRDENHMITIKSRQDSIIAAVRERKIRFQGSLFETTYTNTWTHFVHFDPENKDELVWPVVFIYPGPNVVDFIENFSETTSFLDQIKIMFNDHNRPAWDEKQDYNFDTITCSYLPVTFESNQPVDFDTNNVMERLRNFDINLRLIDALQFEDYLIEDALPRFFITLKK